MLQQGNPTLRDVENKKMDQPNPLHVDWRDARAFGQLRVKQQSGRGPTAAEEGLLAFIRWTVDSVASCYPEAETHHGKLLLANEKIVLAPFGAHLWKR